MIENSKKGRMKIMDIKEKIHATTEELLSNMERLVAIDSQLGTPAEGMPFGEGPARFFTKHCRLQMSSDSRQ